MARARRSSRLLLAVVFVLADVGRPLAAFEATWKNNFGQEIFPLIWRRTPQSPQVPYRLNQNGAPGVSLADTSQAVQEALQSWTNVSSAFLQFTYQGTTALIGLEPGDANGDGRADSGEPDGINVIAWRTSGWEQLGFARTNVGAGLSR